MELTELLNDVKAIQVIGEVQRKDISAVYYDSRKVVKGSVFAAIKGFNTDGHSYIMSAINQGADAVIMEEYPGIPDDIFIHSGSAKILVENSRKALAEISSALYNHPSRNLKLTGITGTNGKTTTSFILKSIYEEAGNKTGLLGTIANYIGDTKISSKLTTPESNELNHFLMEMIEQGCTHAVMEVSSHSLMLYRVYNIHFSSAVFTNITSDHLDFHRTFENYFSAKKMLFDGLDENSFAMINSDDKSSGKIIQETRAKKYSYGTDISADFRISNITYDLEGTRFLIDWKGKRYNISTSLIGEFNAYNAAAAFTAAVVSGINPETAITGIKKAMHVPGRFEVVGNGIKKAVVDYSHTADSLEKALIALRKIAGSRKIVTVFGCGGNRDKTKRPVMGEIASSLSDSVIVTSDNPRFEDPDQIIKDILKGISLKNYKVMEDRELAIKSAIKDSEDSAVILIAGKGHEDYQEKNGVRNPFSDKETAEKYLN